MKIYLIKNEEGLYSTGGYDPLFKKQGKVWNGLGYIKNHLVLSIMSDYSKKEIDFESGFFNYMGAILVEVDLVGEEFFYDYDFINNYMAGIAEKRHKKTGFQYSNNVSVFLSMLEGN